MSNLTREQNQLKRDVREILRTPQGKRLMAYLKRRFADQTYVKGDPTDTAFREGKRWVVTHIERLASEPDVPEKTTDEPKEDV